VVADLIRAWPAAVAAGVLPGYFWALVLRPASALAERLAFATALSLASVPTVAVILARAAGSGITLWVALASVLAVLGSGALVWWRRGAAPGTATPVLPPAPRVTAPLALALLAAALLLALITTVRPGVPGPVLALTAAALLAAGALAAWRAPGPEPGPTPVVHAATEPRAPAAGIRQAGERQPQNVSPWARPGAQLAALAAVLALTAIRAYAGVIRFDWPYLRGGDQYSHAVMAEQMMRHGTYPDYLVYPPGFSALTAVVCRFAALPPLTLFPVLAPALVVLTALGAYALAARLWGGWYGTGAAALSGLVLTGAYAGFADGRYPDLVSAYFLLVMTVAALVSFYQGATLRSAALVVVVGAAAMFYHSVAALYLVALLALVAAIGLPYLLLQRRGREARALTLTLAGVAVLAACYAGYVYKLAAGGHSATSQAVSIALGSQPALSARHLLTELSPSAVWLGLLGFAALAVSLRHRLTPPRVLAAVTLLAWCLLMYAGSRTALDGFPQRFERDLGAPLTITGALGLGLAVRSLSAWRPGVRTAATLTASAVAVLAAAGMAVQAAADLRAETHRTQVISPGVVAAGQWLARHNTGGTVISTPYLGPGISNRAVLALGGFTGLQSYPPRRIAHPRSLPPAGKQSLLDSREVLLHPQSCQSAGIVSRQDVRYVFLYRSQAAGTDLAGFAATPGRYRRVFENRSVVIYAPVRTRAPCSTA
jgi:hypothetical protein